jgi:hypothetical protein
MRKKTGEAVTTTRPYRARSILAPPGHECFGRSLLDAAIVAERENGEIGMAGRIDA